MEFSKNFLFPSKRLWARAAAQVLLFPRTALIFTPLTEKGHFMISVKKATLSGPSLLKLYLPPRPLGKTASFTQPVKKNSMLSKIWAQKEKYFGKKNLPKVVLKDVAPIPPFWNNLLSYEESYLRKKVYPSLRCNSVISVSKNFIYLTIAPGYEIVTEKTEKPFFFPTGCYLLVLKPYTSKKSSGAYISSAIELPDTTEGIITLDKEGLVFCTHASIASSITYYFFQQIGFPSKKPTGGVTVLGPKKY